jgi:hypothetical protein
MCGDGLCFEVPPLASDALLITLHPLLENVLQIVSRKLQEDIGTGVLTFHFRFSVSKALLALENRGSSHCIVPINLMDEL